MLRSFQGHPSSWIYRGSIQFSANWYLSNAEISELKRSLSLQSLRDGKSKKDAHCTEYIYS